MTRITRETPEEVVPLDTIFRTLSHPTRRRILTTLIEHELDQNSSVSTDVLTPDAAIDEDFHIRLYHQHLPRLDTVGFIDWDPDTGTIAAGPHYEEIEAVVSLLAANEDALPTDWP